MLSIPVVCCSVIGVQLDRSPEFLLRGLPVPIIILNDQSQCRVRLSQVPIKLKGSLRRGARFRHEISLRTPTVTTYQGIRICQAGISSCVFGIFGCSLLKVTDSLFKSFCSPLVKKVLTLEIEVVRLVRLRSEWLERRLMIHERKLNLVSDLLPNLCLED